MLLGGVAARKNQLQEKNFGNSAAEQVMKVAPGRQSGKGRRRPGSCRCWTRPPPPGSPGPRSTKQSGGGCEKEVVDLDAGRGHGRNASLLLLSILHDQHYPGSLCVS